MTRSGNLSAHTIGIAIKVILTVLLSVAFIVASFYLALFFRRWKHKRDIDGFSHDGGVSLRGGGIGSGGGFGMIHFNRGGGVQCNYPVVSQAAKVGQGTSFGPSPLKGGQGTRSGGHSPVLPFKSSDTLFTATPGGNSFDHSGWTAAEREVCPYATFQMPQHHSQQVGH